MQIMFQRGRITILSFPFQQLQNQFSLEFSLQRYFETRFGHVILT